MSGHGKSALLQGGSRLSIVVLPFANLNADPEQDYFAEALVTDLTTDLSRITGSFVISQNTAFTYKGKRIRAEELGRELDVSFMIEGSVRREYHSVRVNVQLVDTRTGGEVWAQRFDGDADRLFALQDAITSKIAATLNAELVTMASQHQNVVATPPRTIWSFVVALPLRGLARNRRWTRRRMCLRRHYVSIHRTTRRRSGWPKCWLGRLLAFSA